LVRRQKSRRGGSRATLSRGLPEFADFSREPVEVLFFAQDLVDLALLFEIPPGPWLNGLPQVLFYSALKLILGRRRVHLIGPL
jgi:hypothetical protein